MTDSTIIPQRDLGDINADVIGIKKRIKNITGYAALPSIHLGDGDTSETDFAMPAGQYPLSVSVAGVVLTPGSGEEYTVSFDGYVYTVVCATAPGSGEAVVVIPGIKIGE